MTIVGAFVSCNGVLASEAHNARLLAFAAIHKRHGRHYAKRRGELSLLGIVAAPPRMTSLIQGTLFGMAQQAPDTHPRRPHSRVGQS
jgi:hypothetical protein